MISKIKTLFEYRKLPELLSYKNDKEQDTFLSKLYKLQENIYHLDKHLESNWEVSIDSLEKYWNVLYADLSDIGLPQNHHKEYLHHLQRYQEHELSIRQGEVLSRISLPFYYYYKSCDVRLIRRLIYDFNPSLSNVFELSDWTIFDLVTEINDDIDDIEEDQTVINGNGFVLNAFFDGIEETYATFASYLSKLSEKQRRKSQWSRDPEWTTLIENWTLEQVEQTTKLLEQKHQKIKDKPSLISQNKIVLKFEEKNN